MSINGNKRFSALIAAVSLSLSVFLSQTAFGFNSEITGGVPQRTIPWARSITEASTNNCLKKSANSNRPLKLATENAAAFWTAAPMVCVAESSNPAATAIPATGSGAGTGAPANPYPSAINVTGVSGAITKVTATLIGFSHLFPSDVDVLLVGPGGQSVVLMSDVGGGTDAVNANLTFDDTAPAMGTIVVSGTFRPTNAVANDPFPAPAPVAPFGTGLSVFNGTDPNGNWNLFIVDDAGGDTGSLAGGWSLSITTDAASCGSTPCTLTIPADVTVPTDPGSPGAVVNFNVGTDGDCGAVTAVPSSGSLFPVGTTVVTVTATKPDGSTMTDSFNVTVNDLEAPAISGVAVDPSVLWSPNHQLVDVNVDYNVNDNYSNPANLTVSLSVSSNENSNGPDDGNTEQDWFVIGSHLVQLRAERNGTGSGRVYTITIMATDEFGNSSTQTATVLVPLDQGTGSDSDLRPSPKRKPAAN
jgi:subtilisin-like proprotein convertase family protein